MSTDDKLEINPFPPGKDPQTGAVLIGTTCYSILGAELTIDHGIYGQNDQIWNNAFYGKPGQAPQMALAAPAVFIMCAQAFRVQEAHMNDLYSKLSSQQEKIAELEKRLRDLELGGKLIN